MSFIELLFIAIGLAMDCFAVSFSAGSGEQKINFKNGIILALSFGLFQGGMPLIGWFGGELVVDHICHVDHWIVFVVLTFIGGKMLLDGIRPDREPKKIDFTHFFTILILSIATSIDALAVGFSFSMLPSINIVLAVCVIGMVSFIFTIFGIYIAGKISHRFRSNCAEIIGGVILIAIGIKILITHLIEKI